MDFIQTANRHPAVIHLANSIAARVPDEWLDQVQHLIVDGMSAMYDGRISTIALHHQNAGNPLKIASAGIRQIIEQQYEKSCEMMPILPMLYVAQLLACEWFDFLDKTKCYEITPALLDRLTNAAPQEVFAVFGIDLIDAGHYQAAHLRHSPTLH